MFILVLMLCSKTATCIAHTMPTTYVTIEQCQQVADKQFLQAMSEFAQNPNKPVLLVGGFTCLKK